VPTIISHLLHSDNKPLDETSNRIRFGRSASSALSPDVQNAFEKRFGVPIVETMGLTETAAQILSNPLPPGTRKIGSPGKAYGNEACILSKELKALPPGIQGEIAVRGPNVMRKYFNNSEATLATFTPDGWLRTGDLGHVDDDGYYFVTGRLKELIIKGGENIAPREIDEALYSHPDVIEAAAFARPCDVYGERVEAAVKLKPGSELGPERLIEICRKKLGNFKSPDFIYILGDLPKGPSGKIQRIKLVALTLAGDT
jgi:acyl-CoA synthetase (AMP-forming)/AMP-acid ligase II